MSNGGSGGRRVLGLARCAQLWHPKERKHRGEADKDGESSTPKTVKEERERKQPAKSGAAKAALVEKEQDRSSVAPMPASLDVPQGPPFKAHSNWRPPSTSSSAQISHRLNRSADEDYDEEEPKDHNRAAALGLAGYHTDTRPSLPPPPAVHGSRSASGGIQSLLNGPSNGTDGVAGECGRRLRTVFVLLCVISQLPRSALPYLYLYQIAGMASLRPTLSSPLMRVLLTSTSSICKSRPLHLIFYSETLFLSLGLGSTTTSLGPIPPGPPLMPPSTSRCRLYREATRCRCPSYHPLPPCQRRASWIASRSPPTPRRRTQPRVLTRVRPP